MAIMFGNGNVKQEAAAHKIKKTLTFIGTKPTTWTDANGVERDIPVTAKVYDATGNITAETLNPEERYFITFDVETQEALTIEVGPNTFPGTLMYRAPRQGVINSQINFVNCWEAAA